jgi:hypothetical protein
MTERTKSLTGRAAMTLAAPHDTESIVLADGDMARFGRVARCAVCLDVRVRRG